jgi:hypothetical protein
LQIFSLGLQLACHSLQLAFKEQKLSTLKHYLLIFPLMGYAFGVKNSAYLLNPTDFLLCFSKSSTVLHFTTMQ